jgi:hypothetical protein
VKKTKLKTVESQPKKIINRMVEAQPKKTLGKNLLKLNEKA